MTDIKKKLDFAQATLRMKRMEEQPTVDLVKELSLRGIDLTGGTDGIIQ